LVVAFLVVAFVLGIRMVRSLILAKHQFMTSETLMRLAEAEHRYSTAYRSRAGRRANATPTLETPSTTATASEGASAPLVIDPDSLTEFRDFGFTFARSDSDLTTDISALHRRALDALDSHIRARRQWIEEPSDDVDA